MIGLDRLLPPLLRGLWITIEVTAGGAVIAVVLAWLSGLGRLAPWRPVRWLAGAYVEVFRGSSALVLLFWGYYVLPMFGLNMSALVTAIVVLGLQIGAYGAEIVRGAVVAIPRGQHEAALALSLSPFDKIRLVIAPQALVAMLPPLGNLMIELLKSSALVSLITLGDLTYRAQVLRNDTLATTEVFGTVLLMYFALALVITFCFRAMERHFGRWRKRAA